MDKSSSFELSSETIDKSFGEYDTSEEENYVNNPVQFVNNDINPVQKTINKLAKLQVDARLSMNKVRQVIPIINETADASINIPNRQKLC